MKTKPKDKRLYIVRGTDGKPFALIEAQNQAQARNHWSARTATVAYAEQTDIIAATKAGLEVEEAGETEADPE
jgi:hypothetical protein